MKDNSGRSLDVSQYTPDSLIKILPRDAQTISFPSPYFTAYFPDGVTLKDIPDQNFRKQYPNHFPSSTTLSNLESREIKNKIDIPLSDFIR